MQPEMIGGLAILAYPLVGFVVWIAVARHEMRDNSDRVESVGVGFMAGVIWPVVLLGFVVGKLAGLGVSR